MGRPTARRAYYKGEHREGCGRCVAVVRADLREGRCHDGEEPTADDPGDGGVAARILAMEKGGMAAGLTRYKAFGVTLVHGLIAFEAHILRKRNLWPTHTVISLWIFHMYV